MSTLRQEILSSASGEVLEIGFGTGLNLPYYPSTVKTLTAIDPNEGVNAIAKQRIQDSPITVTLKPLSGESLPLANNSFDTVVCTWTLCSIPQVDKALQETFRVLKPNGKFIFIEHGLSPERGISTWQNRITPLQKKIADGCHLNRPIKDLVAQFFDQIEVEEFYAKGLPKVGGYFYKGTATKL